MGGRGDPHHQDPVLTQAQRKKLPGRIFGQLVMYSFTVSTLFPEPAAPTCACCPYLCLPPNPNFTKPCCLPSPTPSSGRNNAPCIYIFSAGRRASWAAAINRGDRGGGSGYGGRRGEEEDGGTATKASRRVIPPTRIPLISMCG